jgi:hypothetical protein
MFHHHSSETLNQAFSIKPFQGTEPETAKFLFIGLDANYATDIENNQIFPKLMDYLQNGTAFWKKYGIHHPFLLPQYRGDGQFYHTSFAKIGFRPEHATEVSFIELLHVPTYGRSSLTPDDLSASHLRRINDAILHGPTRFIFIPDSVARLMRASGEFPWLRKAPRPDTTHLKVWHRTDTKTVFWHYHFSVYGKFNEEKLNQLRSIGNLID